MKMLKILGKNFKLLFRKKTSLLTVLFAPILVIFMIGFAFSSTSVVQISLGYTSEDNSPMTLDFIESLKQNDYLMKEFLTKELCVRDLEHGLIHACIGFPKDFIISNNKTNNINFIVDKGRTNLVYSVIDSVSENIDIKSDEVSKSLTRKITETLGDTYEDLEGALALVIKLKAKTNLAKKNANDVSNKLGKMDLAMIDVGISDITDDVNDVNDISKTIKDKAVSTSKSGIELIESIRGNDGLNSNVTGLLDELENKFEQLNETAVSEYNDGILKAKGLTETVGDAMDDLDDLEDKLEDAKTLRNDQIAKIRSLKSSMQKIIEDIDSVKELIVSMQSSIENIEVTSSDQIVNPITTSVETISSETNRMMILFPYALMLIIMFVSLLLASTLVVVEKQSKSAFRVFTTPTRDEYFIITSFLTAFIVVITQVVIILALVNYFVTDAIMANIGINVVLLVISVAFFTMLGMAIGYLFKTQQAANIATISIGAIFLFLSNIILPIETVIPMLRDIVRYNPFVMTSELLRKSILFNVGIDSIYFELGLLFDYTIIILIVMVFFQRLFKAMFFRRVPKVTAKLSGIVNDLVIGDNKIKTRKDLVNALQSISDEEYEKLRSDDMPKLKLFFKNNIGAKFTIKFLRLSREKLLVKLKKKEDKKVKRIIKHHEEGKILGDDLLEKKSGKLKSRSKPKNDDDVLKVLTGKFDDNESQLDDE